MIEFLKSLGVVRLAATAAVTGGLIGFFAFLILRVTAPQMTPPYTDLSVEDCTAVVKELERQAIPYELRNNGALVRSAIGFDQKRGDQVAIVNLRFADVPSRSRAGRATCANSRTRCTARR